MFHTPMPTRDSAFELQRVTREQKALVRKHVEELTRSRAFSASKRAQDFLRLIIEHALAGETDSLRERMIGVELFHRAIDYDTANDSVVRVTATETRKKLIQAYAEFAVKPEVRLEVAPGSYVPRFIFQAQDPVRSDAEDEISLAEPASARPEQPIPPDLPPKTATPAQAPSRSRGTNQWLAPMVIGLCALILLILSGIRFWPRPLQKQAEARTEMRSIAVLPFENLSGDPNEEYLADGMTEELIADLGQMSELRVISRTSAMSFKGTQKSLPEIARELRVDGVVEGSLLRDQSHIRLTVRLIDPKSDRPVWVEDFSRNSTNFLTIESELAQAIANQLSLTSSLETRSHFARRAAINEEAEDLYLQGMLKVYSGSCDKAIAYFQKAIEKDAKFANAYATLAHCYGLLGVTGGMPSAEAFSAEKTNAQQAIWLDDTLSEGHTEMADALINMKWDWKGAEKELDRALVLNPNSASTHEQYANYLSVIGNSSAAIEEGKIAVKLDPLSGRVLRNLGYIYYFSHQYDQALSLLQLVDSKYPTLSPDIFAYGEVYAEKGRFQESINEFLKLGDNPHALGHLGNAYARAGKTVAAREIIPLLEKHIQRDRLGAYEIALIYVGLRENSSAFEWLNKAIANHETGLLFVKVEPLLDPLRADPRFDQIPLRVGLADVLAGGSNTARTNN